MRVGGIALLLVFVAGAAFGFYALGSMMNSSAPVDSYGATVANTTNITQAQVVEMVNFVVPVLGVMVAVVVAVLILFICLIYFMNPPYRGRGS